MNILVIGAGGREHALAWRLKKAESCRNLYIAPGNPGTAQEGENLLVKGNDFEGIASAIREKAIDLVVIGPEQPLADGLVNFLAQQEGLEDVAIFGPLKEGAVLESSKRFAKEFMQRHDIPTAAYRSFDADQVEALKEHIATAEFPLVLKASGLAAGKGVSVCQTRPEAEEWVREVVENHKFGEAGAEVVAEEFLQGVEFSVFVITDGGDYLLMPQAKDYKRLLEDDKGPNTGGMGAISPVPFVNEPLMQKVEEQVIQRTLKGLQEESIRYRGFLYFGLMNVAGEPHVIEYNVRLGDPETQVVLPRLKGDFAKVLYEAAKGNVLQDELRIIDEAAATVVLASAGYPGSYEKGKIIHRLDEVQESTVFHAGTKLQGKQVLTNGGRVLTITSVADTLQEALQKSYSAAVNIHFEGKTYRKDIGQDVM